MNTFLRSAATASLSSPVETVVMNVLCIIPARGGSKGIPRKNIRPLCGVPLLAYSIRSAQGTPAITRIVVSTDDAEIEKIARSYGADVVTRPLEISGDAASSEAALEHVLLTLRAQEGYEPERVVFLQATSPLRAPNAIQAAFETMEHAQADSLFSACRVEGYVWRASAATLTPVNYDPTKRARRQDLTELILEENGSIYIFKPWVLYELQSRLGGKIARYEMDRLDSFQIDSPSDLAWVEQLLTLRGAREKLPALQNVRLLVLDFDGVMTDNTVWTDERGIEAVQVHRGDGWGVARLKENGVRVIVLSTETNPVVAARCRKLGIEWIQGSDDKLAALRGFAESNGFAREQIAFLGNDVNDLACLGWVGAPMAVADAVPPVQSIAQLITTTRGGHGAVREIADRILAARTPRI